MITASLRVAVLSAALFGLAACADGPRSPIEAAARAPAADAGPVEVSGPARVALLLPQTTSDSRSQAEAADIAEAARLAAARSGGLIDLQVYDTGGAPAAAAAAARRAAAEGASLILGPLSRETTRAVRAVAEETGVTVLSFSSDSAVGGPPVYLLGDLPENEVDRILGYAAAQGLRSVAVLAPQDDYGDVVTRAAYDAAPRHGARIAHVARYQRSFEGVQEAVSAEAGAIRASGADAVLIAEGDIPLQTVASFLAYNDVVQPEVRYLGTAFWDGPATAKEALLQGGWFAAPDRDAGAFAEAFRAATGREPGPRASLGWDAAQAAADMVREARASGDATPFGPEDVTGGAFRGAGGPFAFTAGGGNRRALTVYEATADGFVPLDAGGFVGG
jgi:ABC-type branched-subunit amino acid transport system substrate-binding protein